ncbi:hypothetical protein M404DRAFT_1009182 [Pisolithus tinctorius Marx 270]|uniref:Uncharacterized protein n=1 Tax=Pisolithus tinctorius Marx 270 TaxID=870435 RepID=A0A0C3J5X9_PISTI|nr:hypothetical protein M404DRAFT_1009182 [Pisolithus tinctorius Marx 270]
MRQTFKNNIHHHALDGRNLGLPFVMQPGKVLLPVPIAPISEGLQPHPAVTFSCSLT